MADLKAQATRRDPNGRLQWKLTLVKMLYQRGYTKEDILELFRFIDWLMVLPDDRSLASRKLSGNMRRKQKWHM